MAYGHKSIPISPQLLLLSHPYTRYADDRRIPSCLGELRLAPSGTRWAKNGKYEYCHKFSNSKISLNCPLPPISSSIKPRIVVFRGGEYIKTQSIGLRYFSNDMRLTEQQYSYLPFLPTGSECPLFTPPATHMTANPDYQGPSRALVSTKSRSQNNPLPLANLNRNYISQKP